MINYSPSPRKVLHMWRVRAGRLLISNDKERHTLRCVAKAVCKPLLRHVARQAEVPRRTPQHPVELMQQDCERMVRVLAAGRLYLGHDGRQGLLGRVDVDVTPAGSPLAVALDASAEEVHALVDVGDEGLFR